MSGPESVEQHYAQSKPGDRILEALQALGKDLDALTPEDIAPLGEFHTRGLEATRELARLAGVRSDMHVLDVGCGIGGPARTLAREFGCQVTGIDLTEEYCQAAQMLNERVGLDKRVTIKCANALELPYEEGSFELVWTQHASMNIAEKEQLYQQIHRVTRPGGRFVFHDILAGEEQPLLFPVPWSRTPDTSALIAPVALRQLLERLGFSIQAWVDKTQETLEWFKAYRAKVAQDGPPPLHVGTLLGPEFNEMSGNVVRNLKEGRIVVFEGVLQKA